jgi:uncharacterized membrane protein (UPF0136 family)
VSATSVSFPEQDKPKLAVSFGFLLSLYAIVPLCLAMQLIDQFGFDFALRDNLPNSPGHFLLFQLLFGTPHIIASSLLLVSHREYLNAFKFKLIAMTVFIAVFFGVGSLFISYKVLYIITACWTVYHVLKQQHGVAKAVCKLPKTAFNFQVALSVLAGIFIYIGIFLNNSLEDAQAEMVLNLASGFTLLLLISTLFCQGYVDNARGMQFLWANTLLVIVSWYLYREQYYFLAILMPRLVHDITAYSFYVTHDYNRHGGNSEHRLYRLAKACRLPVVLVLPLLSVLLTYLLQAYGNDLINWLTLTLFNREVYKAITLGLFGYLALMHYYSEAFVWSAGSPLRNYIIFKR